MSVPFFSSKSKANQPDFVPANASVVMPNVFVVPPEEDKTPPWCFFDAGQPELSHISERLETDSFSIPPADSDSSIFRRGPPDTTPEGGFETRVLADALMTHEEYDNDSGSESSFEGEMEIEEDDGQSIQEDGTREPSRNQEREPADDSDVIEVVKVSRRKSLAEDRGENQSLRAFSEYKRSMTLKSRASKVFRSLRGSLKSSKPRTQDAFPPPPLPTRRASQSVLETDPSARETVTRPRTPTISRKGSSILSQLFAPHSLKSRSSVSSFDEPMSSHPAEANQIPSPPISPQSSYFGTQPLSRRTSLFTPSQEDETHLRAASPTPTTSSSKSQNRRFSIMNLNRIFSFSSSSTQASSSSSAVPPTTTNSSEESDRATPTPRSDHSTPSVASSVSTVPGPQTPRPDEEAPPVRLVTKEEPTDHPIVGDFDSVFDNNFGSNLGLGLSLDLDSPIASQQTTPRKERTSISWSSITPTLRRSDTKKASPRSAEPDALEDLDDTSLEMRLDSFHFDDLSFDANRF